MRQLQIQNRILEFEFDIIFVLLQVKWKTVMGMSKAESS